VADVAQFAHQAALGVAEGAAEDGVPLVPHDPEQDLGVVPVEAPPPAGRRGRPAGAVGRGPPGGAVPAAAARRPPLPPLARAGGELFQGPADAVVVGGGHGPTPYSSREPCSFCGAARADWACLLTSGQAITRPL